MRPGVSLEQANQALVLAIHSGGNASGAQNLLPLLQIGSEGRDIVRDSGQVRWLLCGVVGIGLLLTCANVSPLFLGRSHLSRQEFAIRAALGAGRARIARDLLVEGLLPGLLTGGAGLGLVTVGVSVFVAYCPPGLSRLAGVSVDGKVVGFTFVCSLACSLLFSLMPIMRFARGRQLHQQRGAAIHTQNQRRTQDALVISQIALALVLLVASGLMFRTCLSLLAVDPGFSDPNRVQTFRLSWPESQTPNLSRLQRALLDRLAAIPGVDAPGFASAVPLDLDHQGSVVVAIEGAGREGESPPVKATSPGFLSALGTSPLAGRGFK